MKFVTAEINDELFVGVMNQSLDKVIHLRKVLDSMGSELQLPNMMIDCISLGDKFTAAVKEVLIWLEQADNRRDYEYSLSDVKLLAPIPRPRKNVFCVGKNYAAHAIELGSEKDIPEAMILFSKAPTAVIGHEGIVLNHKHVTDCLDYEGELAVIIGKKGKQIAKEEAMDYVFGYTIINDITARDLQERHKQYLLGKSLDTSCPMGPYIVHKSTIANPGNLNVETKVNGEVRQSANTEQFIFDIPTIISTISQGTTLESGDIIATGTPAGVGKGFKPPRYLNQGDVVEVTIDGIGTLRNMIEE
ncbi:MAG TPA: fumarylacetoacetate hydrolase family protein [Bacillus bacterium]|nr:fumarylacetoacetate hydrolase family protein [Bacillus sp. (in: firmicutes)]